MRDDTSGDSTPESDEGVLDDIDDQVRAGYDPPTIEQQERANEDAGREIWKGGYDKPGGRPEGEA